MFNNYEPVGAILAAFWVLVGVFNFILNRDTVSPAKIIHAYLGLFFLAIFFKPERPEIVAAYICLLLLVSCLSVTEGIVERSTGSAAQPPQDPRRKIPRPIFFSLWLLTVIPVIAQLYLISIFGGPVGYFNVIAFRVREFQGLNDIVFTIKIIFSINLIYFCYYLLRPKNSLFSTSIFLFHCLITTSIGLLSGSRSLALMNFVWMVIIYNYIKRPVRVRVAALSAIAVVTLAFGLGFMRNDLKWEDGGISSAGFSEQKESSSFARLADSATAKTGIEPLRLIYDQGVPNPKLGMTFFSALTNLIPRVLWPDKPESGGIVLTKEYTGNAWGGTSYLSTGLVAESMLNFGLYIGTVLGFFLLMAAFLVLNLGYQALRNTGNALDRSNVHHVVIYIYLLQFVSGMIVGEFANSAVTLLTQTISLIVVRVLAEFIASHFEKMGVRYSRPRVAR